MPVQSVQAPPDARIPPRRSALAVLFRFLLHAASLVVGIAAFVAYEHFKLEGASTASTVSLVAAAVFGFSPVRWLLHEVFTLERTVVHVVHGVGGLLLMGLTYGGAVPGGSVLTHAATAPFAIMGAAQALMHQNHPRNAEEAAAVQRFATSLPEVAEFTRRGDLASPANARRAVTVLTDLIGKAQALGETELRSDPEFQSAWQKATTHVGLSLGLDAIDRAVNALAANPATAGAVPDLRRRLAAARKAAAG
jgi:hypothetical protein